jgi:hypothetical protein
MGMRKNERISNLETKLEAVSKNAEVARKAQFLLKTDVERLQNFCKQLESLVLHTHKHTVKPSTPAYSIPTPTPTPNHEITILTEMLNHQIAEDICKTSGGFEPSPLAVTKARLALRQKILDKFNQLERA